MQPLESKLSQRMPRRKIWVVIGFLVPLIQALPSTWADGDREPEIDVDGVFCHGSLCSPCVEPGFRVGFIAYTLRVEQVLPGNLLRVKDDFKATMGVFADLGWHDHYHVYEVVSGLAWEYDLCELGVLNRYGTHGLFAEVAGIP